MAHQPGNPAAARVTTPSGLVVGIPEGSKLVFGRGPDADLTIPAGRGLSRRAGVISAMAAGAWIANISRTHALYTEGDGYRIRLPRMEERDEPSGGWFVRAGTVLVGSRAMLDEGRPLAVIVSGSDEAWGAGPDGNWARGDGEATLLPIYLDPMTKLFLVALMWCRPWLLDTGAVTPLPRSPRSPGTRSRLRAPTTSWSGSTPTRCSGTGCPPGWLSTSRCCATRSPTGAWSVPI